MGSKGPAGPNAKLTRKKKMLIPSLLTCSEYAKIIMWVQPAQHHTDTPQWPTTGASGLAHHGGAAGSSAGSPAETLVQRWAPEVVPRGSQWNAGLLEFRKSAEKHEKWQRRWAEVCILHQNKTPLCASESLFFFSSFFSPLSLTSFPGSHDRAGLTHF